MKKYIISVFVLFALLAGATGKALAGTVWELLEVRNDASGPTFIFRVSGEFKKDDLKGGFVTVQGGETYSLYCVQTDEDIVRCHTTKKVGGHNVVVGFGGIRAWVFVPPFVPAGVYCYPVYEWDYLTESSWELQGSYCQEEEAKFGDRIYDFYAPEWGYYEFIYLPGDFCGWADPGAGYYYSECPDNWDDDDWEWKPY